MAGEELLNELELHGIDNSVISAPSMNCENAYRQLFTVDAVRFLVDLANTFNSSIDSVLGSRSTRQVNLDSGHVPRFRPETQFIREGNWTVEPLPPVLLDRRVDVGDVNPNDAIALVQALNSGASGVQVDCDDGFAPTWSNTVTGLHNLIQACYGKLTYKDGEGQDVHIDEKKAAVIMFRPRAWNMVERHVMVNGREMHGALVDFGLWFFHCGNHLLSTGRGPFLYLSKIEHSDEARLWNDIFCWAQDRVQMPRKSIKACVLIENVLASFQTHEILYELRDHSMGLNCGMWDYAASFVNKFRHRKEYMLPDRSKYVSMDKPFMMAYRDNVIQTCHRRNALATGGMTPVAPSCGRRYMGSVTLPSGEVFTQPKPDDVWYQLAKSSLAGKRKEISLGADGCLVYDLRLVKPVLTEFEKQGVLNNQRTVMRKDVKVTGTDLLAVPVGDVSYEGLVKNVKVGILFIEAWFRGEGSFILDAAAEDSATAEISRSQVWQWLRHCAKLNTGQVVTRLLVRAVIFDVVGVLKKTFDSERIRLSARIFEEIVNMRAFPPFITSFLIQQDVFWTQSDSCWL